MAQSELTIDGHVLRGGSLEICQYLAVALAIVRAGDTRLLVLDGRTNDTPSEEVREAVLITPTSKISASIIREPARPEAAAVFAGFPPNLVDLFDEYIATNGDS